MGKLLQSRFFWRVCAVTELVLLVVLAGTLLRIAMNNLLLVAIIVVGFAVAFRGSWMMFTGSGGRFRHGLWVAFAGVLSVLSASIVLLNQPNTARWLAVSGMSALVYAGVFAILRNLYWQRQREKFDGERVTFENPYLIINPKSGNGRAQKAGLAGAAKRMGIKVIVTKRGQDIQKLARDAIADGADVLGISGGDGSIGAVAKVAMQHDLPLVVLPGGTRCHFARDLGMDPRYLIDALMGFTGVERRVDVGDINGRIFLNNVSLGAYADIVDHPEYREQKLAVTRKVLQEIVAGKKSAYPMRFSTPEGSVTEAVQVLIGVNRYTSMKVLELGHRERMDEGVLQVNVVLRLTDAFIGRLLRSLSLDRLRGKMAVEDFQQFDTKKLRIKNREKKMVVGVDGEREEYKTPIVVSCRPGALKLCVPAEGVRPRPKSMFSRESLKRVLALLLNGEL